MQILDVEPAAVLRNSARQVVLVQAENAVAGCWCVFENMSPANAPFQHPSANAPSSSASSADVTTTQATKLGHQLLACAVPDLIGAGVAHLNLRVALTQDLRTRS
jgi:hypothetical protein